MSQWRLNADPQQYFCKVRVTHVDDDFGADDGDDDYDDGPGDTPNDGVDNKMIVMMLVMMTVMTWMMARMTAMMTMMMDMMSVMLSRPRSHRKTSCDFMKIVGLQTVCILHMIRGSGAFLVKTTFLVLSCPQNTVF